MMYLAKRVLIAAVILFGVFSVVFAQEKTLNGLSSEEIKKYPQPNVTQVYPDDKLLYDRIYRRLTSSVEIYDSPNGSVVSALGSGFNFVTVMRMQDGWAEINPNKWVKSEYLSEDVLVSRFAGVKLPDEPLPYTMGWLLRHLKPRVKPGADSAENTETLLRYTKVNLYSYVEIDGYRWYQIGVNQWVHQFNVAKILPVERPLEVDTERWVSVDLYEQVMIAYEGTKPVYATLVSSGLSEWPTNEGLFHVYVRYPRTVMSGAYGQPDFYYLEEVPWTMYFDKDIGLHGTYWHDGFGYRQSHGCVNISITDAYWLYNWASAEFDFTVANDLGPAVYVYSSGEYQ